MQTPLILSAEATAARNSLHLLAAVPEQFDFGAQRTPVTGGTFQLKVDPAVLGSDSSLVDQYWTPLVGNNHIKHAAIPEIGKCDRASIVGVGGANGLSHIVEFARSIV